MSDTTSQVLDRVQARYRVRFSGQARVSRDPDELAQMLAELDAIAESARAEGLGERWEQDRALYAKEKEAVEAARAIPGAIGAHRLRVWADLAMSRYKHGFAGQDRRTRDVSRLDDIRAFLRDVRQQLHTMHQAAPQLQLDGAIRPVEQALELYAKEAERIRVARTNGPHAEQGTRLANLANDQFEHYRQGFAGQSRISRHPPRLERIIAALEEIAGGMNRLRRAGFVDTSNDRNLSLVTERITSYRAELKALREAHDAASVEDRVNALGAAANQVFGWYREEFAGRDRATRDVAKLDVLFELLWPIALEMDEIDREDGNETNERNLGIVLDNLLLYTREFDAIRAAKADA
jgi:hypothetical protein